MKSLRKYFRESQVLLWDRFSRATNSEQLARMLTQASIDITKKPHVAFIESNTGYGNVRACALDMMSILEPNQMTFFAHGDSGMQWAKENGVPARRLSLTAGAQHSADWELLLRSAVSVHESHDWWRSKNDLFLRALLAGSYRIQLWHGSTGPIGKEIGLGRLNSQPTLWHFIALASTSVSWDAMVHEPNADEERRKDRVQSRNTIHDIEYRLVPVLREGNWQRPEQPTVVVAPTFPETVAGEATLVNWVTRIARAGEHNGWSVHVHLHPATKKSVRSELAKVPALHLESAGVKSSRLSECSVVVTDFSSIAHDALLIGTPVVMAVEGLTEYQSSREILIDQEQWDAAYVANQADELIEAITSALTSDNKLAERQAYRDSLLKQLASQPGVNTQNAITEALTASKG